MSLFVDDNPRSLVTGNGTQGSRGFKSPPAAILLGNFLHEGKWKDQIDDVALLF